jgi:thiosulfate/3-mercaptopyruvate sulfurtransferase
MKRNAGPSRRDVLAGSGAAVATAVAGCFESSERDAPGAYTTPAAGEFERVVDGAWLADRLEAVELLDVRGEPAFTDARIEGARRLSETIRDHYAETDDGYEASPDAVATALERSGIAPDDDVVVFGALFNVWATPGVYTLEAIGHEGTVSMLDGGVSAWRDAGGATATGSVDPEPDRSSSDATLDTDVLATRAYVAEHVREDGADAQLVDNRSPAEYAGTRGGDRFERHGHITGAINVAFRQNFDGEGRFRPPADLEELWLDAAALDPDVRTITYCTTGVRGSVGWFVLTQLGWDDVRNYEGSWLDWGTLSEADGYYYTSGDDAGTVVDPFA